MWWGRGRQRGKGKLGREGKKDIDRNRETVRDRGREWKGREERERSEGEKMGGGRSKEEGRSGRETPPLVRSELWTFPYVGALEIWQVTEGNNFGYKWRDAFCLFTLKR